MKDAIFLAAFLAALSVVSIVMVLALSNCPTLTAAIVIAVAVCTWICKNEKQ